MEKMTKREKFAMISAIVAQSAATEEEKAIVAEFVQSEVARLDKKASKTSDKSAENKALILSCLGDMTKPVTVTELQKACATTLEDYSNQKISAILRLLVADGKVVKTIDKGKSYFAPTTVETAEDIVEKTVETEETVADILATI